MLPTTNLHFIKAKNFPSIGNNALETLEKLFVINVQEFLQTLDLFELHLNFQFNINNISWHILHVVLYP